MNKKIKISETKFHKTAEVLCIVLQAGTILYLIWKWDKLPNKIPTHYNGAGEIDGYGSKWTVWFGPFFMVLAYVTLRLVEKHPGSWNTGVTVTRQNKDKVYLVLKDMLVCLKLSIILIFSFLSIWTTTGARLGIWFLPTSLGLTLVPLIISLIRLVKASKG